jgi:putative heme-binding domain-containing protein
MRFPRLGAVLTAWLVAAVVAPALAQRDLKTIPNPDPELERQSFRLAEGLEVNLWAAEPLLAKPIQMHFDAQGRLWVASSEVYPHILPGQQASDKILILEDTDFDGRADKSTVFAEGLLIPTGVVPDDADGAYVANSTELLHFRDLDGDGKADQRRIVLSGFGTEDTHHLLHTFRFGPDGWLYMNQSIYIHSHVETPYGVRRLGGGGIWRLQPRTLELEVFCRGFVNPWGHVFDPWGQSFATDGAYGEGINYVFPGAVFVTAPGATRIVAGLNPGSPKHCGLEIVSGRHFPEDWQGQLITSDFRAHRVCRFALSEDGSGYAARQLVEVIQSSHPAFRPVDARMGPDGALYIADWYNPIIQHGEVDFRDQRRDHAHGRIWRVAFRGRPRLDTRMAPTTPLPALVERLAAPEAWVRDHARLMLRRHEPQAVAAAVAEWLARLDPADPQYDHHRLEALWAQQTVGVDARPLAQTLAQASRPQVRAAAIRYLAGSEVFPGVDGGPLWQAAVQDAHPRVRLEAVRALARWPTLKAAELAAQVLDKPLDRWLDFAVWQTLRDLAPVWLPAVRAGQFDFQGRIDHLVYALRALESPEAVPPLLEVLRQDRLPANQVGPVLATITAQGGPREWEAILDLVAGQGSTLSEDRKAALLAALVEAAKLRRQTPAGDLTRLVPLLEHPPGALVAAAAEAAGVWKVASARPRLTALARQPGDDPAAVLVRRAALEALVALGGPASRETLVELAGAASPWPQRSEAVAALAALDLPRAAALAVAALEQAPADADLAGMLAPLLARRDGATRLAEALTGHMLPPEVARRALRAARNAPQPTDALQAALVQAGGLAQAGWRLSPALVAELAEEVARHGNPLRGEAIYRTEALQCQKCHALGGAGGQVGPDLSSVGASAPVDYLIESLLAPAAKVKENYHSKVILDQDGRLITGIPVRQTQEAVTLRDAEDRLVTVAKNQIEEIKDGRSLMPDGLVDPLTREELVDLIAFLAQLGKVGGPLALPPQRYVRRWETLLATPQAVHRLRRTSFDTAATDDPELPWKSVYSRVAGDLPLADLPVLTAALRVAPGGSPTSFVRFGVEVSTPGRLHLVVDDPAGLLLWVDGRPTPLAGPTTPLELDRGLHRLTLAVDHAAHPPALRVELADAPASPAQFQLVGGK